MRTMIEAGAEPYLSGFSTRRRPSKAVDSFRLAGTGTEEVNAAMMGRWDVCVAGGACCRRDDANEIERVI